MAQVADALAKARERFAYWVLVRIDPYFARRQWRRCRIEGERSGERVANGASFTVH